MKNIHTQVKLLKFLILTFSPFFLHAQLTVPQIMQDSKWIGTSPSQIAWSYNSQSISFKWNPEKNISDSSYIYDIAGGKIVKQKYLAAVLADDISNGKYNSAKTKITFIHNNDVYLLNIATKNITRITQTEGQETNPIFLKDDKQIVYQLNNDLFEWNGSDGETTQLTHFENGTAPAKNESLTEQQKWLNAQALQTSSVIKKRKDKADAGKIFLDSNKEEKELRTIYLINKDIQNVTLSPDARFVTYNLYAKNDDAKDTKVPAYVTQDGYTKDLPSRSKVGRPDGIYAFYVFDKLKDNVIEVLTDSIPFITTQPQYKKLYAAQIQQQRRVK